MCIRGGKFGICVISVRVAIVITFVRVCVLFVILFSTHVIVVMPVRCVRYNCRVHVVMYASTVFVYARVIPLRYCW